MVDHAEEHTLPMIHEHGYWAGITLYPQTKVSPQRAVDMIERLRRRAHLRRLGLRLGSERAAGQSRTSSCEMRRRGHPDSLIHKVVWDNPLAFLGQSSKFQVAERTLAAMARDRMRLGDDGFFGLTYCTNIHPARLGRRLCQLAPLRAAAQGAPVAGRAVRHRLAPVRRRKQRIARRRSAGALRRLAARARPVRIHPERLPVRPFHGQPVKDRRPRPRLADEERVAYTLRLVRILAALLPDGQDGSISTSPLSYKPWIDQRDRATWQLLARNVGRVAEAMAAVEGKSIHLDLEPEPDGLLERSTELVRLLRGLAAHGARARRRVLRHLPHAPSPIEDPAEVMDRYDLEGRASASARSRSARRSKCRCPAGAEGALPRRSPIAGVSAPGRRAQT